VPRKVYVIAELPTVTIGKINNVELRNALAEGREVIAHPNPEVAL
jgi:acyl-coenzyme A synthetase/AMP-(fatty) acid ligase